MTAARTAKASPVHPMPREALREELLRASKKLEDWSYDDTTARECRQYQKASDLVRQAALTIPTDPK